MTVLLVAVYAAGVVVLGQLVHLISGGSGGDLVVAASTLTVAALFGPIRGRVQSTVDRRFNRARYDAVRTTHAFAHRLRDELDPDLVAVEPRATTGAAVQPRTVSVWLQDR